MASWRRWLPVVNVWISVIWIASVWHDVRTTSLTLPSWVSVAAFQVHAQDSDRVIVPAASVRYQDEQAYILTYKQGQVQQLSVTASPWRPGYWCLSKLPSETVVLLDGWGHEHERLQVHLLNDGTVITSE
ncbi:hypothetical protein IJJ08_00725 [bacterium]|nr:hypothetical protein [bacterium]